MSEDPKEIEKIAQDKEYEAFKAAIGDWKDSTMLILRTHLYTENLLERIINSKFPRGDKILENASLSYNQKLILVDSFDFIPDSIISSLRNLNKIRNQCAHQLHTLIGNTEITKIGSPFGKDFTKIKREAKFDDSAVLRKTILSLCAGLSVYVHGCEHEE